MEITASKVLSHARFSNCSPSSSSSSAPSLLSLSDYYKRRPTFIVAANQYQSQNQKQQKKKSVGFKPRELKKDDGSMVVLRASASESPTPTPATYTASSAEERWLLQPVGDGDSRHLGSRVEIPGPFEIASNEVTVGRLPEKADMVIPVATVSGLHARIQKKAIFWSQIWTVPMEHSSTTSVCVPGLLPLSPPETASYLEISIWRCFVLSSWRIQNLQMNHQKNKPKRSQKPMLLVDIKDPSIKYESLQCEVSKLFKS